MTEKRFKWVYIKDNLLELKDNGIVKVFNNERLEELLNELHDECEFLKIDNEALEHGATKYAELYHKSLKENEQLKKDVDKYNKKIEIMADAFLHAEDLIDVEEVFFTEVYEPSENFNEEILCEISNLLFSDYLSDKND